MEKQQIKLSTYQRLNYLDTLKGICVMWIVWYHTTHPDFVNYPFFNITLFFVSGILYKPYKWNIFWRKKVNQLIIPLCFFYSLYYLFLLAINYLKYHSIDNIIYNITDVFKLYTGNEAFIVNYPLWFICAILCMHLIMYVIEKFIKVKLSLVIITFFISIIGFFYIQWIPTPLMLGRSLPYFIYFTIGYLSKNFLLSEHKLIENRNKTIFSCIIGLLTSIAIELINFNPIINLICNFIEFSSISFLLIYFCRHIQNTFFSHIITFFGTYSMIVLGLHDMYLTTFMIIIQSTIGPMNLTLGLVNLLLTSLLLLPSIYFLNRFTPQLVGKKEVLKPT